MPGIVSFVLEMQNGSTIEIGVIAYHRSQIEIVVRPALEAIACKNYQVLESELTG